MSGSLRAAVTPARTPKQRDLLRAPVLGPFLRWKHARTTLQALCLGLAALLILDGLFGPQLAPRNLAGVLPWVHWRGFVVLALIVAGNLFCMACPFMLPRRLAKRFLPAAKTWPRALSSKWVAVLLLLLFFWAYEAYSLWASPWLTAWVAITYFVLAFVVDGFFKGAVFCKHLCPIGQFHFVNGMVSPTEVRVRDPAVCSTCTTKDCIRGRYAPGSAPDHTEGPAPATPLRLEGTTVTLAAPTSDEVWGPGGDWNQGEDRSRGEDGIAAPGRAEGRQGLIQGGCELALYQPRKEGNLDCTYCMECIHACPHDNVGILLRSPLREFSDDPVRSGVGRISRRPDLAALAGVLVFGAFFNAFGMTAPAFRLREQLSSALSISSEPFVLALMLVGGLMVLPAGLVAATAAASRWLSGGTDPLVRSAGTYLWCLVPLGLGMWAAHYLFHLLVGGLTIVPLAQDYLSDLGWTSGTAPQWGLGPMVPEGWLVPIEVVVLQVGLFLTLAAGFRIAQREEDSRRQAVRAFLPWAVLATVLFIVGLWLMLQPMEMRGTFQAL